MIYGARRHKKIITSLFFVFLISSAAKGGKPPKTRRQDGRRSGVREGRGREQRNETAFRQGAGRRRSGRRGPAGGHRSGVPASADGPASAKSREDSARPEKDFVAYHRGRRALRRRLFPSSLSAGKRRKRGEGRGGRRRERRCPKKDSEIKKILKTGIVTAKSRDNDTPAAKKDPPTLPCRQICAVSGKKAAS